MIVESDLLFEFFIVLLVKIELATWPVSLVDRGLVIVEDGHLLERQLVCLGVVEAGSNARRTVVKHLALNLFYNS